MQLENNSVCKENLLYDTKPIEDLFDQIYSALEYLYAYHQS